MSFSGMSASTGQLLGGIDHLRQSVADILTTPIGSRVMRRAYGSRLADLVDTTMTPLALAQVQASALEALLTWEPRLAVTRILAEATADELEAGQITITVEGEYLPEGRSVRLDGIVL